MFKLCNVTSLHTFASCVTGDFYLHIRHKTFLNPPAVLSNFIQILQLIVVTATHFQNVSLNSFFRTESTITPAARLLLSFSLQTVAVIMCVLSAACCLHARTAAEML